MTTACKPCQETTQHGLDTLSGQAEHCFFPDGAIPTQTKPIKRTHHQSLIDRHEIITNAIPRKSTQSRRSSDCHRRPLEPLRGQPIR